jgi:hypothetical protein
MNNLTKILIFLCFVFFLIVITGPPGMAFEDETFLESEPASHEDSSGLNLGAWMFSLYRDHISAVDSDRCPSVPTCSSYAVQVFKKHGFFMGWMMTVDRLIHEGSEELSVSPRIYSEGQWKIYDPVENNDFWWSSQDRKPHE